MRKIISLLFAFFLLSALVAPIQISAQQSGDEETQKLTPEEMREARELVEAFRKRFEESDDYAALVNEFYVEDFIARLRTHEDPGLFMRATPELESKMSDEQLLELYFFSSKFLYLGALNYFSKAIEKAQNNKRTDDEEIDDDVNISEVYTPDVIALIEKDPYLSRAWASVIRESKGEDSNNEEADDDSIDTLEKLQAFLSFFKEATPLMRKNLNSQHGPHSWQELMEKGRAIYSKENNETTNNDLLNPRITILSREFFGSPEGTRLICVDLLPFHVDLVRVDGKLKILHLYFAGD